MIFPRSCTPHRRLLLIVAVLLLLCALLLCRIEREARGVWRVTAPSLSVVGLRDSWTGPVLWMYMWGQYRGQWQQGEWYPAEPTPYPTQVPYPTSTPYPTATPEGMKSA